MKTLAENSVIIKLASLAVHADEMLSPQGHQFDQETIKSILADDEVKRFLSEMDKLALLPLRRDGVTYK